MALLGAPPPALLALLSPENTVLVHEVARLWARLPAYLRWRRARLAAPGMLLWPLPLDAQVLIHSFEEPTTIEEAWSTGLGAAP